MVLRKHQARITRTFTATDKRTEKFSEAKACEIVSINTGFGVFLFWAKYDNRLCQPRANVHVLKRR